MLPGESAGCGRCSGDLHQPGRGPGRGLQQCRSTTGYSEAHLRRSCSAARAPCPPWQGPVLCQWSGPCPCFFLLLSACCCCLHVWFSFLPDTCTCQYVCPQSRSRSGRYCRNECCSIYQSCCMIATLHCRLHSQVHHSMVNRFWDLCGHLSSADESRLL